ncbi:MAG: hypothetical protein V1652_04190 [bacterium]
MLSKIFSQKQSGEKILRTAKDSPTMADKRKLVRENIDVIRNFLDAEDAKPTRHQFIQNIGKLLDEIASKVLDGKKLYNIGLTPSYKATLQEISRAVNEILQKLKERNIDITEISKQAYWRHSYGEGKWSLQEVTNFPLDWLVSAVVKYNEETGKVKDIDMEKCLTANEVKECLDLIKEWNAEK